MLLADREMVELESDEILRGADKEDVSLLVVGDPFGYVHAYTLLVHNLTHTYNAQRNNTCRHNTSRSCS